MAIVLFSLSSLDSSRFLSSSFFRSRRHTNAAVNVWCGPRSYWSFPKALQKPPPGNLESCLCRLLDRARGGRDRPSSGCPGLGSGSSGPVGRGSAGPEGTVQSPMVQSRRALID